MLVFKKFQKIFLLALFLTLFLSTCSKEEVSDYEKLGAGGWGTIKGNVVDYGGGDGLDGVSVSFSSGTTTYTTTTDSNGDYSKSSLPLNSYTISYSKSGYINSTQSGALEKNKQTLSAAKLTMLPSSCGSGTITGTIKNALNGNTVGSVYLYAREGLNVTTGSILNNTTTTVASGGSKGTYSLGPLDAGLYTVQTKKSGHMSTSFNVYVCGNRSGQNANISDSLAAGAMRMILSWEGSEDFDSHLEIPCTSGTCSGSNKNDKSHLWWTTDQDTSAVYNGVTTNDYHYYYDIVGTGSKSDNVTLDQDNMNGSGSGSSTGPETITISKLRSGTYRYHVHAFDQKGLGGRYIADNSTFVQVCYDNSCRNLYPPNSAGDLWTVFDYSISDGLDILNIMGSEGSEGDVDLH